MEIPGGTFVNGWSVAKDDQGRAECECCGKIQWQVIHSCAGVPKTVAALERWEARKKATENDNADAPED